MIMAFRLSTLSTDEVSQIVSNKWVQSESWNEAKGLRLSVTIMYRSDQWMGSKAKTNHVIHQLIE